MKRNNGMICLNFAHISLPKLHEGLIRLQLQNVWEVFFILEMYKGVFIYSWVYFFICISSSKATQPRFWNSLQTRLLT